MNSRRLLLVAFHYGPRCATGGFRWNAMVRHLESRGWSFDIITRERYWNRDGNRIDSSDLSERARIFPVPAPTWTEAVVRLASRTKRWLFGPGPSRSPDEPARAAPMGVTFPYPAPPLGLYRRITSLLDGLQSTYPEIVWARRATQIARRCCREERYRAIIVSSPPHASHLVGLAVQKEFDVPFVADFRDLWKTGTGEFDRLDSLSRWLAGRYEPRVFREAHRVIFNTALATQTLSRTGLVKGPAVSIPNGFDANGRPAAPDGRAFRIVMTGQWYPFSDLDAFFATCRRLRCRLDAGQEVMHIEFVGTPPVHRGVPLETIARFHGLHDVFTFHGRVTRAEAARLQEAAAVLVAFDQASRPAIPVKFYDYAQTYGTMLLLGDPTSDLALAAARLGVKVHPQDDASAIDAALAGALKRWRDGHFAQVADPAGIFDRVHQSHALHELLLAL